jgi:signal transduction histidine kinase
VRALLAIPIFRGELLWGLLIVHQCSAPRVWENWETSLMQQLAVQTGIALQQGWLYEQMQQLNATLEQQVEHRTTELKQASDYEALLKRITDQVRDSLDETQILQTAVQEIALALNVRCCDAGLYNAERTTSTIFCDHTTDFPSAQGKVIPIQDSVIHHQLSQGQSLQFCFLLDAFNNVRPNLEMFTILSSPILDNQTVLGDLWLFKASHETFSDMEVRLVEQVANQCAIALRQSRLYQEVQAQVKELGRLNSLKDDFLSTVSHELRAPMANIKMATQMLEIAFKPLNILDDRTSRYLQILKDECQRETDLINDLLDLSRLEMGRAELNLTSVNLQCWLPHLADAFQERADQQQQQFSVAIAPTLAEVTTDLSYLERILTELLHNACKYTPSGETISLSAQLLSDAVQIQVTNTGVQILDEERDRIFEKFYRIPNNDPWKHGGTGLGLALVKKMAELMSASLQLEHCVGQTTFTLKLPQKIH